MSQKITTSDRWDAMDREHFRSMLESDSFKAVITRLTAERDRAIATCTTSADQVELVRAQGAVAALRSALEIPGRIFQEMARMSSSQPRSGPER